MNTLHDFFKNYAELISLLTFLLGLLWGNRLALGRDKRKEFNEITKGIRRDLERHIIANHFISGVDFGDKTMIANHFNRIKRRRFLNIVKEYKDAHKNIQTHDSVPYNPTFDESKLKQLAFLSNKLVKYLKPR